MAMSGRGRPSVVVDAVSLADDAQYRGIGTFVRNLLPALVEQDVFVTALATAETSLPPGVDRVTVWRSRPSVWSRHLHDVLLPLDLVRARGRADVVLAPAQTGPLLSGLPIVQTVHDIPDPPPPGMVRSLRRATVLVCDSDDTAADVEALLGRGDRVVIAPLGVADTFRPGDGGGPRHLLFVGEHDPRKRRDLAIEIHNRLVRSGYRIPLVMIGRIAPWFEADWAAMLSASIAPELIDVRGYVSPGDLVTAYQSALALLVTSETEGFGLPTVEAMACGTPVLAFRGGATSSVVGDGGVLFNHGDLDGVVSAVCRLDRSPENRNLLSVRALRRAADFSWSRCASIYADAIAMAAATA